MTKRSTIHIFEALSKTHHNGKVLDEGLWSRRIDIHVKRKADLGQASS